MLLNYGQINSFFIYNNYLDPYTLYKNNSFIINVCQYFDITFLNDKKLIENLLQSTKFEMFILSFPHFRNILNNITNIQIDASKSIESIFIDFIKDINFSASSFSLKNNSDYLKRFLRIKKQEFSFIMILAQFCQLLSAVRIGEYYAKFADKILQITLDNIINNIDGNAEQKKLLRKSIVVLSLGKLGGMDLNYSSDIDIICFYDDKIINDEYNFSSFFTKIGNQLTAFLQEQTELGFVFRVDFRLRPDPAVTKVVSSLSSAINYYYKIGEDWERAALIKARFSAGNIAVANKFINRINNFLWRNDNDYQAVESIKLIQGKINTYFNQCKDINKNLNIKYMLGGIRDIELFCQLHQLFAGGKNNLFRKRNTCLQYYIFSENKVISRLKVKILINNYVFFRQLENFWQMLNNQQTHSLPNQMPVILLSWFNKKDISQLKDQIIYNLSQVHSITHEMFNVDKKAEVNINNSELLKKREQNTMHIYLLHPSLAKYKFLNSEQNKKYYYIVRELILKNSYIDKKLVINRFHIFFDLLPSDNQIVIFMAKNPKVLSVVTLLFRKSEYIFKQCCKFPKFIEYFVKKDFIKYFDLNKYRRNIDKLFAEINVCHEDDKKKLIYQSVQELLAMARFQLLILFHLNSLDSTCLADNFTKLAEKNLHITSKFIKHLSPQFKELDITIMALGSLASYSLSVSSDLDLLLIFDEPKNIDEPKNTDKNINISFLAREFVQRLNDIMPKVIYGESFHAIDLSLRPNGKAGYISYSICYFKKYIQEKIALWEIFSFRKLRFICGNEEIANQALGSYENKVKQLDFPKLQFRELLARINKTKNSLQLWDVKFFKGGIFDLDIFVQALCIYNNITLSDTGYTFLSCFSFLKKNNILDSNIYGQLKINFEILSNILHASRILSIDMTRKVSDSDIKLINDILHKSITDGDLEKIYRFNAQQIEIIYQEKLDINSL